MCGRPDSGSLSSPRVADQKMPEGEHGGKHNGDPLAGARTDKPPDRQQSQALSGSATVCRSNVPCSPASERETTPWRAWGKTMMTVIDFSTARRKLTCPRDERVHGATSTTYSQERGTLTGGALIPTGSAGKLLQTPCVVPTMFPQLFPHLTTWSDRGLRNSRTYG